MSVTDLEIEQAIREAWAVLSAASPSARRLAAALLAVTGARWPIRTGSPPMTCGATGLPSSPTRAPGWQAGVLDQGSRAAGCPLPCCRKVRRGARTPICYGVQPCGSAPMSTLRAGPRTNRDPDAGMKPNNPALPARGSGGANHPHLSSNPVAAGIKCPRTCLTAPCPSH